MGVELQGSFSGCGDMLEERVTRLHGQLQRQQQQLLASPTSGSADSKTLDDLYEDIHWLILVTGDRKSVV